MKISQALKDWDERNARMPRKSKKRIVHGMSVSGIRHTAYKDVETLTIVQPDTVQRLVSPHYGHPTGVIYPHE